MPQMIQRRGEGAGDALVELAVRECRQTGGEGGYGLVDLAGACGLLRFPLLALFVKLLAAVRGLLFHALLVERSLAEGFQRARHHTDFVATVDGIDDDLLVAFRQTVHQRRQVGRSEERRRGNEGGRTCTSRWTPDP